MTANKRSTKKDWIDPDDAPDLSAPKWKKKLDAAPVKRGRPPADETKVSTTIRLDADVVQHFRSTGAGWQSRINAALKEWIAGK